MKAFWWVINILAIPLGLRAGYEFTAPQNLGRANPDGAFCVAALVGSTLLAVGLVFFSVKYWNPGAHLRRPSWDRNPFNWWGDPLEALSFAKLVFATAAVGGALRYPPKGSCGFWMDSVLWAIALGFLIGHSLVYRIFQDSITTSPSPR